MNKKINKANMDKKLKQLVVKCSKNKISVGDISDNSNLIYDLGFDSICMIKLITNIEEVFKISFNDEELSRDVLAPYGILSHYVSIKLGL